MLTDAACAPVRLKGSVRPHYSSLPWDVQDPCSHTNPWPFGPRRSNRTKTFASVYATAVVAGMRLGTTTSRALSRVG